MHRMMLLRPEEIKVNSNSSHLQYYQPDSERLNEGIVSFGFKPVTFDYSHIDSYERFKPEDKNSTRLCIWDEKIISSNKLKLQRNFLEDIE